MDVEDKTRKKSHVLQIYAPSLLRCAHQNLHSVAPISCTHPYTTETRSTMLK